MDSSRTSVPPRKSTHSSPRLSTSRTSSHSSSMGLPRSDSGYNKLGSPSSSSRYRSQVDDYITPEEEYQLVREEIEHVKDKSLSSTRNALRRIRETEEVASASMKQLDEQSEKLNRVEAKMTQAEYHAHAAENKTQELQKLSKNFVVSTFSVSNPFTKSKRKQKEFEKKMEMERAMESISSSTSPSTSAPSSYSSHSDSKHHNSSSSKSVMRTRDFRLDDEKDCEKETEIDRNLSEISDGLSRLKLMGLAMTESIEQSSSVISRIDTRTEVVHDRVRRTDEKLQRLAKK
ncbi:hypothetical protein HMI56_002195 [Coelomomyces lativittatus]|nr:hypothetical protein HMI56_002195 [Coelomomyces lativittatus]